MILNFRVFLLHCASNKLLTSFYLFFLYKFTFNTNLYDIFYRLYLNDFYFNNYYLYWIQFFLLPLLLFIIMFLYYPLLNKHLNPNYLTLFVLISLLLTTHDYYIINNYPYIISILPDLYNNLLYNPLNKYHPFIFFISYIYIYNLYFNPLYHLNLRVPTKINFINPYNFKNNLKKINKYWILLVYALFSGSWWALQEGSWGGWWNWDSSEVFGLLILTVYLYYIHSNTTNHNYPYNNYLVYTLLSLLIFIYLLLQLSYTLVSHNFGLNILSYGYINITFYILFLFFLLISVLVQSVWIVFIYQIIHYTNCFMVNLSRFKGLLNIKYLFTYTILLNLTYIYMSSFSPILNNFIYNLVSVELFNTVYDCINFKLLLTLYIYLYFLSLSTYLLILTYYLYKIKITLIITPVLQISNYKFLNYKYLHLFLFLFVYIPLLYNSSSYITWNPIGNLCTSNKLTNWYTTYDYEFTINNIYILFLLPDINNILINNFSNFFFWLNSITNIHLLDTLQNNNLSSQLIIGNPYLYLFVICIYDLSNTLIDTLFIVTYLYTIVYLYYKNFLIIL